MKRLPLLAVISLVTLVGMVGISRAAVDPTKAKMYYITAGFFTGGDAITACDSGFHMASLSEIQDPSNLQYAPRVIPAYQASGEYPDHTGWVRTEADSQTGLVYN